MLLHYFFHRSIGEKTDNDDQVDRQGYKYVNIMSSLVHTKRFWNSRHQEYWKSVRMTFSIALYILSECVMVVGSLMQIYELEF
jgi:glutaredoxin-related protein